MRKTNTQKGITLIALIITIVVLLILAVVAINAVTGDGIIQHATNAKTEHEKAQEKENSILSYYEKYLEAQGGADIWDGKTTKAPEIKDGNWYIYNCNEFKFFANFVNGTLTEEEKNGIEDITSDTIVYLMANLDLGARQKEGKLISGTQWISIGSSSTISFNGTFEGNNHYIKGIFVNDKDGFTGIFGYSTNTIKNLIIKDSYIEVAGNCVGGIVGRGDTVINCHNINTNIIQKAGDKVGGIAGQANVVEGCTNTGIIINEEENKEYCVAGGIVGLLTTNGSITNCKNLGSVTGIGGRVGGVLGSINAPGEINSCINKGKIVNSAAFIGGIVGSVAVANGGESNNLIFSNCYNTGEIIGDSYVGGIIGYLSGTGGQIKRSYNIGIITGTSDCGGIIGNVGKTTGNTIEKCYYLKGTSTVGISNISNSENIVEELEETDMKTKTLANKLNASTNTGAWVGSDTDYPRLNWE